MDESPSLDPRINKSRVYQSEESQKRNSLEMKALLKKWYGLPKKDPLDEEDETGPSQGSSATSEASSLLLPEIPKKRPRFLQPNPPPPLLFSDDEDEEHLEVGVQEDEGTPPEEEEPQNLVMNSSRRASTTEEDDAQNNNNKPCLKEEDLREGICSWCLHSLDMPRSTQFSMSILDDPKTKRSKTFCSERCFTLYRRAAFKKNKYCDLCKKPTTSPSITYQTLFGDNLIFCSDSCLKTYKTDEASRREKLASQVRRAPLSDNIGLLQSSKTTLPLQNKKSIKQTRRPQEKSFSQTPIVKVKPDTALKSSESSRKKQAPPHAHLILQRQRVSSEQIPNPVDRSFAQHPLIPPPSSHPSPLRGPPFMGLLPPEHTNQQPPNSAQPLLPLAALAGALAAASSSRNLPHPPPQTRPLGLPSPLTLCPMPFFVPLPIPIPLFIPIPGPSNSNNNDATTPNNNSNGCNKSSANPGTSQELPIVKRETLSPSPPRKESSSIKTECLSDELEERRRGLKRGAAYEGN